MSFSACLPEIQRAVGRELSNAELDDLLTELQRRQRRAKQLASSDDLDRAVLEAADDFAKEMVDAALIEKRNAAINLRRRLEAVDFVTSQFSDNPALGLEAWLVGVNRPGLGTRASAAAEQNQLRNHYLGGFVADIERLDLWPVLTRGDMDRDIARALWAKDTGGDARVPQEARQIADVIAKWQDVARTDANKAGAWIKKMPGYIVRQSHDQWKIRAAGFDAWRGAIETRLDLARTMGNSEESSEAFLKAVYDGFVSGQHLRTRDQAPSGFVGPQNLAKKVSQERVLHFKSADDWFEYNQQFGTGNIREALLRGFEVNAQSTGLMRRLGTNPGNNLNLIAQSVADRIDDPVKKNQFLSRTREGGTVQHMLHELDGTTRAPVNQMAARTMSGTRAVQRMAKLGASLFSQFGDIPIYASEMRYQGHSMLGGIAESVGNLLQGRGTAEKREVASMLGVVADSMMGDVTARFSIADDDLPGVMSRGQRLFFKLNGMTWWTDSQRRGAVMAMSHRLALHRDAGWEALNPDLQRVLGLSGIDAARWDIIRSASTKLADGREYVVPESVMDLDDAPFAAIVEGQGFKATEGRVSDLKREIADQVRSYFTDRASFATLMPDQRTRALMQRGTRPGTVEGELMRFLGELKAFPIAVIQKTMGREIYGRGANTLAEALRNGNGEMLGMAQLLVWTTIFGYISMSTKDILKGRNPRDVFSEEGINWKTFGASMVQGGGAGIYGDFLFGEVKNRFGGGLLSTLAGPTLGSVEDLADLYGRVRDGDDAASQAFRTMISNVPFANLYYTRIVMDYLFLYQIQETLNPGALQRLERTIEKENAQTFWLRPSSVVN